MDVERAYHVVECPRCDGVALEVAFDGFARVKCPRCGARLQVAAKGATVRVLLADLAPPKVR